MRNLCELNQMVFRIVSVIVLMLVLVVSAGAYTIVMRDGRRIEIPSHFVVTPTTLTYEVAQGFQITLQMALIDIAATENANNERPGSLWKRAHDIQLAPTDSEGARINARGKRTITNRDLEASMRRRRESERAYEIRRRQLGLPTVEESRRRAAIEQEVIGAELHERRSAERQTEDYWRARASALRTEMAVLDAEIGYLRARLDELPASSGGLTSFNTIAPFGFGGQPFGDFGGRGPLFPGAGNTRRQPVWASPGYRSQGTGRVGFGGGATRSQIFINPGNFPYGQPYGIGFPPYFGSSAQPYDFSYERSALITRFNELAATRAGYNARWRELEDEARRAGAPPGWLRP